MDEQPDVLTLTAEIVASYLGSAAHVQASEIPAIIKAVREALSEDTSTPQTEAAPETPKPDKRAITKSITPDGLISFVDGKSYKTLKRHLSPPWAGHERLPRALRPAQGLSLGSPQLLGRALRDG